MRGLPRSVFLGVSLLLATAALAACGGSASSGDQVASLAGSDPRSTQTGTTTTSSTDFRDAVLQFAQCMRENGVDVPDPTFDANGRPTIRTQGSASARQGQQKVMDVGGVQLNPDDPKVKAALAKCQPILAAARPSISPEERQKMQAAALEYAQCMRQNGIDMPDPDFSNGGVGFQVRANGGSDAKFRAADAKCRSAFQGLPGPGGPPPASGGGNSSGTGQ